MDSLLLRPYFDWTACEDAEGGRRSGGGRKQERIDARDHKTSVREVFVFLPGEGSGKRRRDCSNHRVSFGRRDH